MNPIPPPTADPIARPRDKNVPRDQEDPNEGRASDTWIRYFVALGQAVNDSPTRLTASPTLVAQGAAIGTTSITPALSAAGMYRISYFARITQAATVNSSLTVTLNWTDHGVAQTFSGAAIVGNTTTSWQSETLFIYIDAALPVTYSTAYVSVGATSMLYEIFISIEAVTL